MSKWDELLAERERYVDERWSRLSPDLIKLLGLHYLKSEAHAYVELVWIKQFYEDTLRDLLGDHYGM